jgi:hypothetical protein
VSYVNIPPAYYAQMRPGTPYHPGGKGWLQANVPGWGENPNVSWADRQAVNGLGAAAAPCTPATCPQMPAPPFSYVGQNRFNSYFRTGNAPWGVFPQGPAYAIPRPSGCPTCAGGIGIKPGVGSLRGGTCADCQFTDGDRCLPCPEGSDLPECAGCVGGARPVVAPKWYQNPIAQTVGIGVLTALGTGLAIAFLKKETKLPVGG